MKIGIVNSGKSYLPEVKAYDYYFNNQKSFESKIIMTDEIKSYKSSDFDVLWKFPGVDYKRDFKETKIIHEYNSLSTGTNTGIKNIIKKKLNVKPNGRIFLNDCVKENFNFKDGVPNLNRDMGISKEFFIKTNEKEFDFVYVGSMDKGRGLKYGLLPFVSNMKGFTIILIGEPNNELYLEFKKNKNIIFTGIVNYNEVSKLASKAEYGYNYIPNVFPYNIQTSTKLLEYCAMGLKIVTTNYDWVNIFELKNKGSFLKLNSDLSNLTPEIINKFSFITPNVENLEWNRLLSNINILEFIKEI